MTRRFVMLQKDKKDQIGKRALVIGPSTYNSTLISLGLCYVHSERDIAYTKSGFSLTENECLELARNLQAIVEEIRMERVADSINEGISEAVEAYETKKIKQNGHTVFTMV